MRPIDIIGALILYILWCIGFAADQLHYHLSLQANTVIDRRVLSHVYLADRREVIDDERYKVDDEVKVRLE
ncbi:MAG: hypothetical protein WBM99_13995 [Psychromonas sp.]